jgi:uncharacterized RDD family membrane protein YckC
MDLKKQHYRLATANNGLAMSNPINPFQSPAIDDTREVFVPAGRGRRLANFVIDYFAQTMVRKLTVFGICIVFGDGVAARLFIGMPMAAARYAIGFLPGISVETSEGIVVGVVTVANTLIFYLTYYLVLEATTSRTLGKLLTGTHVVNDDFGKPSFRQVVGRTLARLIPFEAFSFLGPIGCGWHDRLAKTYVVKRR